MNTVVRILAISSNENQLAALARIVSHTTWILETASHLSSAEQILSRNEVQVLLCDERLPDGTWRDAVERALRLPAPPEVVVVSKTGEDRLWAEVLNLGAWDVLICPFQAKEVFRTIHMAWQRCMDHTRRCSPAAMRKPAGSVSANLSLSAGVQ
ncbi:MAG TPA: response regulator [Bryobacteraceae bacterium]|nr:response regulator [Bryobacteraceae bacterium]